MKNNIDNPLGLSLNQQEVEKEFNRIQNKIINNKNITYSEKIFMTIILEFLKQEL